MKSQFKSHRKFLHKQAVIYGYHIVITFNNFFKITQYLQLYILLYKIKL